MLWSKTGELFNRIYTIETGYAQYKIALDMPEDRWAIYVNGIKRVENIYYVTNAKKIVSLFNGIGYFDMPKGMRKLPGGGDEMPRFVSE